jgi:subtilisin family serine protease
MANDTSGSRRLAKKTARKKSSASRERERNFPDRIYALASPPSVGGTSLFTPGMLPTAETVDAFVSTDDDVMRAANALQEAGFEVLQASNLAINIAGPAEAFEQAFGAHLFTEERPVIKPGSVEDDATFIDNADTAVSGLIDTTGTPFETLLEGVAIEEPYYLHAPLALPPVVDYWHLNVPNDVSVGLNAERPHRSAVTGRGIRVAMVDTGFQTHAFFTEHGHRVDPTVLGPGTANATVDEHGHGTGESANIFATAPDVTLLPVKTATASGALVNVTAAFNAAAALAPHIITNSWGSSQQTGPLSAANQALAAAVAGAVVSGIVVVFSAGNGGWGFPGQHPDVISVGGVHQRPDGTLEASDYTSGFMSNIYSNRRVPDVSGLVGMRPRAMYIMLPIPSGCIIDQGNAGGSWPNGDETPNNDGWAAFSGTSAAAPQIAGVCALMLRACPRLTPAQIRGILMQTARDVTTGTNHPNFGNPATVGPDTATGNGLVDAHRAVLLAKLRCLIWPIRPIRPPVIPVIPFQPPVIPVIPFQPPVIPVIPFRPPVIPFVPPVIPFQPPVIPFRPPITPVVAPVPGPLEGQAEAAEPQAYQQPESGQPIMSEEDIAELERLIIESDNPPEL